MATFRMRVFRYTDGSSDKVWAICRDNSRVLVFYGKYSQKVLNGGPIKAKARDLDDEVSRRVIEQLAQGYAELGEYDVVGKQIVWTSLSPAQPANPNRFAPMAYVAVQMAHIAVVRDALQGAFEVQEREDRLIIGLPNGTSLECLSNVTSGTLASYADNGAFGRLAVLAVGEVLKKPVFDQDDKQRSRKWLHENPEQFADIPNLHELAADLRLMAPPVKVKADAVRAALW
jgi:hypothetical protein